eukprot:5782603-Prymnesium_polylepis.1
MGVFAAETLDAGAFVGTYVGTLTTQAETMVRYNATNRLSASLRGDYLFRLDDEWSIDAQNSTHFSRYFNHAEHGCLDAIVDPDAQQVKFYAARTIDAGDELTFDYGPAYWLFRPQPANDSRNFSDPDVRERVTMKTPLSLLHPPPVGTVLPLIPLTAVELLA